MKHSKSGSLWSTVAYWRNLALNLLPKSETRLRLGLSELAQLRKGNGQWRRFPFFYTCLALTEIGPEFAWDEMQYAAVYWQKNLKRLVAAEGRIQRRRAAVGQRLLEKCETKNEPQIFAMLPRIARIDADRGASDENQ